MAATWRNGVVLLLCVLLAVELPSADAQLRANFYLGKCPNRRIDVEAVVRKSIRASFNNDNTVCGGLGRLHFHDCFVEGCDGSLLLDGATSEKTSRVNGGLHGFDAIDAAKAAVEAVCPGVVSCADILSWAIRDCIFITKGPFIKLRSGRRDGTVSDAGSIGTQIPGPAQLVPALTTTFTNKGLSQRDMVVLSGVHTIGKARCRTFQNRLFPTVDPNLNPAYAAQLQGQCPSGQNLDVGIPMDRTPVFDNSYYVGLTQGRGIFTSDDDLFRNSDTSNLVKSFAGRAGGRVWRNSELPASFRKLTEVGVKTGTAGQIRNICSQVNAA